MKKTTATSLEIAPFTLKLPKEFEFKPDFSVEMPGGKKLNIYKTTTRDRYDDKAKEIPAFRVVLLNKKGQPMKRAWEFSTDTVIIKPLDVAFHIEEVAVSLSKTKKTTVEERDMD